jgi:CRP-like cAMP-binding protein
MVSAMAPRRRTPIVLPDISTDACTPALRERLLAENPLFQDLDQRALAEVNERFTDTGFSAGQAIVHEGGKAERLYLVALGIVKLYRSTENGESVLIDILSSGDYFGSIAGFGPEQYTETAEARSTVCSLSIDGPAFRAIVERYSAVALRTVETLSNRLTLAHELLTQFGGYDASSRVAYVLSRLARKLGTEWEGKTLIGAPLSREELASMAGTTTETCSRIISALQRDGVVEAGRRWVAIAATDALAALEPEMT